MKRLTEKDMWDIMVTDIKWDTSGEEQTEELAENLPRTIVISRIADENDISDYLSDVCGFCHDGYAVMIHKSISKLAYQLYIIDWKCRNVYHHKIEADLWKKYFMETEAENMESYSFDDFLWDSGYGYGTMYVCYEEFLDSEYQDKAYMKELLDNDELYELYLRDFEIRQNR